MKELQKLTGGWPYLVRDGSTIIVVEMVQVPDYSMRGWSAESYALGLADYFNKSTKQLLLELVWEVAVEYCENTQETGVWLLFVKSGSTMGTTFRW